MPSMPARHNSSSGISKNSDHNQNTRENQHKWNGDNKRQSTSTKNIRGSAGCACSYHCNLEQVRKLKEASRGQGSNSTDSDHHQRVPRNRSQIFLDKISEEDTAAASAVHCYSDRSVKESSDSEGGSGSGSEKTIISVELAHADFSKYTASTMKVGEITLEANNNNNGHHSSGDYVEISSQTSSEQQQEQQKQLNRWKKDLEDTNL